MSVVRMNDQVNQFQRVAVPGSGDLRLEAGDYRIYFEYVGDGTAADPSFDAAVRLTDPAARPVDLRAANGTSYQMGSHNGQSEFTFHADEAGVYRLTAQGSPNVTVAVGGNLITSIMRTILVPLALGFGGFIAGIAIIVTVVIRGARSQRPPAGSRSGPFAY
ncbi:hypothetical protein [Nocardia sp. NPDC056100]|uniref:hypothetical protein n=1 Tax=Nocardia sp. NPDC056100 TaxID=3345712 RepID=UPI0035E18C95